MPSETLSVAAEPSSTANGDSRGPFLFVVLGCDPPQTTPARFALGELSEISLGRGKGHELDGRRLLIRLDDGRVSGSHARIVKQLGHFTLEDTNSKNGCLLDGERVSRALLEDGSLIEIGHTFLRFRASLPQAPEDREEPVRAAGLETLSPELARAYRRLAQVAPSTVPVIIEGESGTGKEVAARALHTLSGRRGPFVAVNCGAIPQNLVESQLFGHRRGAFSGALEDNPGLIRAAEGGTLFLDEIGELPLAAQAPFLRVLQEREVVPVGGTRPVPVDFRVVCATHRDLAAMVATEKLRHDLFNRLSAFHLELPPLRDRLEDLGLIIDVLQRRVGASVLHPRTVRCFFAYPWPGNIRELEKTLETSRLMAAGGPILPEHLPPAVSGSLDATLDADEIRHRDEIIGLLRQNSGNIAAVARACGKARMQVQRWIKRYKIKPEDYGGKTR